MKILIPFLAVILSIFYFSSCNKPTDRYGAQTTIYLYENKSGKDLSLIYYSSLNLQTNILIPKDSIYSEKITIKPPLFEHDKSSLKYSDSVKVVFADNKTYMYRKGEANNIYSRYIPIDTVTRNRTYKFIFTPADYALAKSF